MNFLRKIGFLCGLGGLLFLTAHPAVAAPPSREALLQALEVTPDQINPVKDPATGQLSLPPPVSAPTDRDAAVEAAAKLAADTGDPELIAALLRYQFAYRSPENTVPARALGKVFLEQSDAFLQVYDEQNILMQVKLFPYLEFGYKAATRGKNKSIRKYQLTQKKLDRLSASLMNAGR